jgi:transposase-like protein
MSGRTSFSHLSEAEGFSHIESRLRSGLRPSEYYRRHNLSEHQFYSWRRRYLSAHPELSDTGPPASSGKKQFQEVKFDKDSVEFSPSVGMEIHYPNGVKAVFSCGSSPDAGTLSSLIKLWAPCSV